MPVYEQQSTGGNATTMLLSFVLGVVIILVAVLLILHGILHVF
jgi:uncharacterized membrane protein YidH (DUF202 family)